MDSEIQIILEKQSSYKQGNCFEKLIRKIIELQRYEVSSNVNYTGMELDLIAKHKDRTNEIVYVECKAKEKVSSSEILSFESKVRFKKAQCGYFIRTKELEHQAKGLIDEFGIDTRYNHLFFFGPEKVIRILQESGQLSCIQINGIRVSKQIFAVTYFGDYIIYTRIDTWI